jgi:hypothetical protein
MYRVVVEAHTQRPAAASATVLASVAIRHHANAEGARMHVCFYLHP